MRSTLLILAAICFGAVMAQAQSAPSAQQASSDRPSHSAQPELQDVKADSGTAANQPQIKSVGPLTPEEAARLTAKNLAKQKNSDATDQAGKDKVSTQAPDAARAAAGDAIVEFHPANSAAEGSSKAVVVAKDKNKSGLKRVHGELYGAKGGTGHAEGGSVGATSKSGKTSVYIDSERAHSTNPQP